MKKISEKKLLEIATKRAIEEGYTVITDEYIKKMTDSANVIRRGIAEHMTRLQELDKKLGIDSSKYRSLDDK